MRWLGVAAALLIALTPAQAAFNPVLYYVKDDDLGPAVPGRLDTAAPPMLYIPPTDPLNYSGGPLQYVQDVAANVKKSLRIKLIVRGEVGFRSDRWGIDSSC